MNRIRRVAVLAISAMACVVLGSASNAGAQAPAGQDTGGGKQPYTMPEYNAEQACGADKNPTSQVKCLDDFVSKYPNSNLLPFVYPMYFQAYTQMKNWPKVIESADKALALGDKLEPAVRYQADFARAVAYSNIPVDEKNPAAKENARKAREGALDGLKTLNSIQKPANLSDDDWTKQKQQPSVFLNGVAANAAMTMQDYPAAIASYKAVIALVPGDVVSNYQIGKAYLAMNPSQHDDAFWQFAVAVTSKSATQQQATEIKKYLRRLIAGYQGGNVCDSLTDAELNELLQLAGSSAERPTTFKIASGADLTNAQKDMTIASVISDLKASGDKAKITWLASCGLEFPDVPGKLLEVTAGATSTDPVTLKLAFVTSDAEFEAATTPNMEVKVVGQAEAAKLDKGTTPAPRFTGTLVSYDPDPAFMVHFDKAKINTEDLPKEKAPVKKPPVRKPVAKKPAA